MSEQQQPTQMIGTTFVCEAPMTGKDPDGKFEIRLRAGDEIRATEDPLLFSKSSIQTTRIDPPTVRAETFVFSLSYEDMHRIAEI